MQDIIVQRAAQCRQRLAQVQYDLEQIAQRQQDLVQESLRLQGALRELEALVVAVPVDGAVASPAGG
jgi:hypothetical protein